MSNVIQLLSEACKFTLQIENFPLDNIGAKTDARSSNFVYDNRGNMLPKYIEPDLFENDLILIESSLPQILAYVIIKFLKYGTCNLSGVVTWLEKENPLRFDQTLGHKFYEYKLKKLLISLCEQKQLLPIMSYKLPHNHLLESALLSFKNVKIDVGDVMSNTLSLTLSLRIDLSI